MYCIQCGVELADSQKQCPLCGTRVFHPELSQPHGEKPYPPNLYPPQQVRPWGALLIVTMCFLLPIFITLGCNLQINGRITWAGIVTGGLMMIYVMFILPLWFKKPNPVIFVPCSFLALGTYLLYIDLVTGGQWFLSFALPITAGAGLVVTAIVTLLRYIRRGRLYIFGGAAIVTGIFMPVMELLLNHTFARPRFIFWSLYPLMVLVLLGITLITIAICRPLRDSLEKRFFV